MSNMTYLNSVYRQPFPQKYITNFIYAHSLPFGIKFNVILYHQVNDLESVEAELTKRGK
jgi:hypothetical protein